MRKLKWTAVFLIVVAIIATALYIRRDQVARELANTALADTDLEVAELSVSSLGVSRMELSHLVVVSASGMQFEVRGLSVPLGLDRLEVNEIAAESLIVMFGDDQAERQALSESVWKLLAIPLEQPDLVVRIDTVTLPEVPVIENAVWSTIGSSQSAKLEVDEHAIEVFADGNATDGYRISLLGIDDEISAGLEVLSIEGDVLLQGDVRIRVEDWLPTLNTLELIPDEIVSIETELAGAITIALDSDEPGEIAVDASVAPVDGATTVYAISDDSSVEFDALTVAEVETRFNYPDMTWTATSESIDGLVTIDDATFPLLLNNLDCASGIRCTMYATIYGENLSWADYAADTASISSPIVVETGEPTRIGIPAEASVVLTGIQVGEIGAASAEVLDFSGTEVLVADGWQSTVEQLQLAVGGLEVAEAISTSGELGITTLTIADSGETVDAEIELAPGATARLGALGDVDDLLVSLPGLSGTVTRRGDELRSTLVVRHSAIEAGIDLVRDFDTGAGMATIRDARISFDFTHLSDYVSDWPFVWNVMSGVLTANANVEWRSDDSGLSYSGTLAANLQKLSGMYEDYAIVGVTTALQGTVDSTDGIALEPGSVSVALIDVGLQAEDLSADYQVDAAGRSISVENLTVEALGGTITARPFTYSADADANEIVFDASAIQLALIAELADFESLDMSGSISGAIPVSIGADTVGVDGGQLASDDPGGVIRYSSGLTEGAAPEGNLAIVTQALSNFEFDTLSSTVDYGDDGELVLTTRLSGINPDTNPNQPIILNLNVDTNIPQMLRSLRAIRTIEDILEERTAE
ncbi:MAG: YdbH domain-containing protein [Woeseiaceae bacterium]|nr:YdbH domain-containing protein [Woeseiaceae bacterium]